MEVDVNKTVDEALSSIKRREATALSEYNMSLESTKKLLKYLADHNMTLLETHWYTGGWKGYRIVSVRLEYTGEEKHYLKDVQGLEPAVDALDILQNGAKFYPQAFAKFIL